MNRLPNFRDYDNPKRKNPYGWAYGYGKNRQFKSFPTKKAKKEFKEAFERKFYSDRDALVSFDSAKWRKFCELEEIAGGMEPLERAARQAGEFIQGVTLKFEDVAKLKVEELTRKQGVNIKRIDLYCNRFIAANGNRMLPEYTHDDCQGWVDNLSNEHALNSLKNHHKAVASVFNLAVKLGHLNRAPTQHITFPSTRGEKRTELFEASDVQKLLNHIWQTNRPLAGVYAILFFTGLRISMIAPNPEKRGRGEFMTMKMIDIKNREIVIPPGIMKNAKNGLIFDDRRTPKNLWPWLTEIEKAKIPEPAQTFNKRRAKLCKEVGLSWPANVHRRSCASYYAAIHGKSRTADLLGNTEGMIVDHYQVATFAKKAEEFFNIFPK